MDYKNIFIVTYFNSRTNVIHVLGPGSCIYHYWQMNWVLYWLNVSQLSSNFHFTCFLYTHYYILMKLFSKLYLWTNKCSFFFSESITFENEGTWPQISFWPACVNSCRLLICFVVRLSACFWGRPEWNNMAIPCQGRQSLISLLRPVARRAMTVSWDDNEDTRGWHEPLCRAFLTAKHVDLPH